MLDDRGNTLNSNDEKLSWMNSLFTDVTEDFVSVYHNENTLRMEIRVTVKRNSEVHSIELYFLKNGDEVKLPLSKSQGKAYDSWRVVFDVANGSMLKPFSYRFKISTAHKMFFWDAKGFYKYSVNNQSNFKYYWKVSSPEWLESAVMYHIFVDRFEKILDNGHHMITWGSIPSGACEEFYGGDLFGVLNRLDYLSSLGVNVLCLTPIFVSSTNHRYDTEDYFNIDDSLGGNEALKILLKACKERNMRVILDGVFNHTSAHNKWFNRSLLHDGFGAYQGKTSKYFDFFRFNNHPEEYEAFWGEKHLPKLNYESLRLKDIIYKGKDSVIKYWMNKPYGVNGWRLDACCMIGMYENTQVNSEVLTELYDEAKYSNQDCYVFGENPFDPSEVRPFKHLDGITNYSGFYSPLLFWLHDDIDFNSEDFDLALTEFRSLLGIQFLQSSKNFIGNHDKRRMLSELNGDLTKYITALTFLFTYVGVPSIYYGEEIGLHNMHIDNDSRICMQWDSLEETNRTILAYVRSLTELYSSSKAIQKGYYKTLHTDSDSFVFERCLGKELIIVALFNSDAPIYRLDVQSVSDNQLSEASFECVFGKIKRISARKDNIISIEGIESLNPIVLRCTAQT